MVDPERHAQLPSEAPERSPDHDCGEVMTWTRAAVWASAAISGSVLSGRVRAPTIYGALVAGDGRHQRGMGWQA